MEHSVCSHARRQSGKRTFHMVQHGIQGTTGFLRAQRETQNIKAIQAQGGIKRYSSSTEQKVCCISCQSLQCCELFHTHRKSWHEH